MMSRQFEGRNVASLLHFLIRRREYFKPWQRLKKVSGKEERIYMLLVCCLQTALCFLLSSRFVQLPVSTSRTKRLNLGSTWIHAQYYHLPDRGMNTFFPMST